MSKAEEKARERRAELIKIIGDMGNNSSDAQVRSRLHALRNQLADSIGNSQTAEACDAEIGPLSVCLYRTLGCTLRNS